MTDDDRDFLAALVVVGVIGGFVAVVLLALAFVGYLP